MFVASASRGAAAAAGHSVAMAVTATTPVLRTGLPKFVIRQRRHSSSKQSNTPERTAAPVTSGQQQASKKRDSSGSTSNNNVGGGSQRKEGQAKTAKGGAGKNSEGKDKMSSVAQEPLKSMDTIPADAEAQLDSVAMPPSVPSTSHYDPKVVHLASIFAQHRPISLHQPVPPSEGIKAFESIFQPVTQRKRTQDVIFTLTSAVKSLESAGPTSNNKLITPSTYDGTQVQSDQIISLEELAKTFRPFKAPPAPVPMDTRYLDSEQQEQHQQAQSTGQKQRKLKSQHVTMSAPVEPMAPMPEGAAAESTTALRAEVKAEAEPVRDLPLAAAAAAMVPFRERMRARYETWLGAWLRRVREQWQLISVKRQRKLKMKKHKYKKFMRRTRNLRRRQDRL